MIGQGLDLLPRLLSLIHEALVQDRPPNMSKEGKTQLPHTSFRDRSFYMRDTFCLFPHSRPHAGPMAQNYFIGHFPGTDCLFILASLQVRFVTGHPAVKKAQGEKIKIK